MATLDKLRVVIDTNDEISEVRDVKDMYLVSAVKNEKIDYLVTGDMDLLILKNIGNTKVVNMDWFLEFLVQLSV